jgi:hypothetical protein
MGSESERKLDLENALETIAAYQKEAGFPQELIEEYSKMYLAYYESSVGNPNFPPVVLREEGNQKLDEDTLSVFTQGHTLYYGRDILKLLDELNSWDVVVLRSGMFGGKSTIGMELSDLLQKSDDIETDLYIAAQMGESMIISRAWQRKDPQRSAKPFGGYTEEERDRKILEILNSRSQVILVDEYTFTNKEDVVALLKKAKDFPGKKVILLGLDTNYLGIELDIFSDEYFQSVQNDKRTIIIKCLSYIKNGGRPRLQYPQGQGTIRYINVGKRDKPLYILDLGLGRLVISKEKEYIKYFPSYDTLYRLFGSHPFFRTVLEQTKADDRTELSRYQIQFTDLVEKGFE